jgi:hypothetical protein
MDEVIYSAPSRPWVKSSIVLVARSCLLPSVVSMDEVIHSASGPLAKGLEYLSFSDKNTCLFCSIVADTSIFKCFQVLTDFALFVCMCCWRQDFVHQDVEGNSVPWVQATKYGAALKAVQKLSKQLVAYMEGLLAVSPCVNGPF